MLEQDPTFRSPLDTAVANNLRKIRHSLEMTQTQFAAAISEEWSSGPSRISELELCKSSITLRLLHFLATRLGVEPTDLIREHRLPLRTKIRREKTADA